MTEYEKSFDKLVSSTRGRWFLEASKDCVILLCKKCGQRNHTDYVNYKGPSRELFLRIAVQWITRHEKICCR